MNTRSCEYLFEHDLSKTRHLFHGGPLTSCDRLISL